MNDLQRIKDNAYMAGILDGEGCIFIHKLKDNGKNKPVIILEITNKEVIEWIHERFGGSMGFRKKRKEHWKDSYSWGLYVQLEIQIFLEKVFPFMIVKKKQASIMLFFLTRDYTDNGDGYFEQMKEVNKKGKNKDILESGEQK